MATLTEVYIDTGATGANNGTSLADAYTTAAAAAVAEARDITAATGSDEWIRFLCYATTGVKDTAKLVLQDSDGWATALLNQPEFIVVGGSLDGVFDETVYVLHNDDTDNNIVALVVDFSTWTGFQILCTGTTGTKSAFQNGTVTTGVTTFNRCKVKGIFSGSGAAYAWYNNRSVTWNLFNCTAQGFRSGTDLGFVPYRGNLGTTNLYNCVAWDAGIAFQEGIGVMVVRNCIAGGTITTIESGGPNLSNCLTSSGVGANPQTPVGGDFDNEVTDGLNGDFSLVLGGNAIGNGLTDPSTTGAYDDIVGNAFAVPWDIGVYAEVITPVDPDNDFEDADTAQTVWRFEQNDAWGDSKRTNELVPQGSPQLTKGDKKEGATSGFLDGTSAYWTIDDNDLSENFPVKNSKTGTISINFWINFDTLPTSGNQMYVFSKTGSGKQSFQVLVNNVAGDTAFEMKIGYDSGASWETIRHGSFIAIDTWYYVTAVFNNTTKAYILSVRDASGDVIGSTLVDTASNFLYVDDGQLAIAADVGGGGKLKGLLDEVVIFNEAISEATSEQLAKGEFVGGGVNTSVLAMGSNF